MKINFIDGRSFILDIPIEVIEIIDECKSIMCPWLVKYLQDKYNSKYNYSFFCKEYNDNDDFEFKYYIPLDIKVLFVLETETKPYYIHSVVKQKRKNNICNILLKYIKNIDSYDNKGFTPLYLACIHSNYDIIKPLLNNGANQYKPCSGYLSPYEFCKLIKGTKGINAIIDIFESYDKNIFNYQF